MKFQQKLQLTQYPYYLNGSSIGGPDKYVASQYYDYSVDNIKYPKAWTTYSWKGTNYSPVFTFKTGGRFYFLNDSAFLEYQITDINKCTYSITKKLYNEKPSTVIEAIQNYNG